MICLAGIALSAFIYAMPNKSRTSASPDVASAASPSIPDVVEVFDVADAEEVESRGRPSGGMSKHAPSSAPTYVAGEQQEEEASGEQEEDETVAPSKTSTEAPTSVPS